MLTDISRFGTYSTTEAVNAGLDLEMPGPSRFRSTILGHAVSSNKVSTRTLNARAKQMLKLVDSCLKSEIPERAIEREENTPETSALLRELASNSIVLLKNDKQVLPMSKSKSVSSGSA